MLLPALWNPRIPRNFGAKSTLNDNLLAYWKLDEISGNRADSVDSNTLIDNNTVGSAPGKHNLAANFIQANLEFLSIADNPDVSILGSKTFSVWVNPNSLGSFGGIFEKRSPNDEYQCLIFPDGSINAYVADNNGVSFTEIGGGLTTPLVPLTWSLVLFWYDIVDSKVHVRINNGTVFNGSAALPTGPKVGASALHIGALAAFGLFFFDGLFDEIGIWDRVLTSLEQTELWNAGAGKFYPF